MTNNKLFLPAIVLFILSFTADKNIVEFRYPKNKEATVVMSTDKFEEFDKEWRGTDYYYYSNKNKDSILCSVLFYKLNDDEVKRFVDFPRQLLGSPQTSPAYPLAYFSQYSPTKKYEVNEQKWGDLSTDFMFRQTDIPEFEGQKTNQKNMFAYTMFGKDLFVNIHLSKINCTATDSIFMRQILDGLKKKK